MNILNDIRTAVEEVCQVDMRKRRRTRNVVDARKIFSNLSKKLTGKSYPEIAKEINIDHVTALYHNKTCDDILACDADFRRKYDKCVEKLQAVNSGVYVDLYSYHLQKAREYARLINKKNNLS